MTTLAARIAAWQVRAEAALERCLALPDAATARLREAMRYSVLGGGKRLRPILVYCTGEAFAAPAARLDAPAAAVELIHAYSLVHDDLPAMDDDDLRRGKPSCHRAFDEGTAVLVGDALQPLAFALLADPTWTPALDDTARVRMIRVLAGAIGTAGMAGGQAIDLESVGRTLTAAQIEDMHRRKTGALIEASVLLGALAAGLRDESRLAPLSEFGREIGLAFQIQDDILDVQGDTSVLGKQTGADAARAKPTYPSTVGLDESVRRAAMHRDRAIQSLRPFGQEMGDAVELLTGLAHFVVERRY